MPTPAASAATPARPSTPAVFDQFTNHRGDRMPMGHSAVPSREQQRRSAVGTPPSAGTAKENRPVPQHRLGDYCRTSRTQPLGTAHFTTTRQSQTPRVGQASQHGLDPFGLPHAMKDPGGFQSPRGRRCHWIARLQQTVQPECRQAQTTTIDVARRKTVGRLATGLGMKEPIRHLDHLRLAAGCLSLGQPPGRLGTKSCPKCLAE